LCPRAGPIAWHRGRRVFSAPQHRSCSGPTRLPQGQLPPGRLSYVHTLRHLYVDKTTNHTNYTNEGRESWALSSLIRVIRVSRCFTYFPPFSLPFFPSCLALSLRHWRTAARYGCRS